MIASSPLGDLFCDRAAVRFARRIARHPQRAIHQQALTRDLKQSSLPSLTSMLMATGTGGHLLRGDWDFEEQVARLIIKTGQGGFEEPVDKFELEGILKLEKNRSAKRSKKCNVKICVKMILRYFAAYA